MCVIVDTNAVHQIFGDTPVEAGAKFLQWLENGKCKLAVGGQLRKELRQVGDKYKAWAKQAMLKGTLVSINDHSVNERTKVVASDSRIQLQSNDPHIIALAQVSGARLLFSNDRGLQKDFKNPTIIRDGKVYSTRENIRFNQPKRRLLESYQCKPCSTTELETDK